MRNSLRVLWPYIATVILWVVLILLCLCSCRTKYVSVPEYHTEYITKTDSFTQRDSILVRDSIFMYTKGDTVFKEKYSVIYKDRYRDRYICDTVVKVDSVRVPYPVERQLTKWEEVRDKLGSLVIVLLSVAVIAAVIVFVTRLIKIIGK